MDRDKHLQGCRTCEFIQANSCRIPLPEDRCLVLHVDAALINPPQKKLASKERDQKKKERDNFITHLKVLISALRNSGGGAVLVHISGLNCQDIYLDKFHELVDPRLNEMIEDGSLFVEIYRKNWINDMYEDISNDQDDNEDESDELSTNLKDFVAVVVLPSYSVVTADFNTKVPLDNCVVDPSTTEILIFLKKANHFWNTSVKRRGLKTLQESRRIQFKAFAVTENVDVTERELYDDASRLAKYIWQDLRLGHYISAFSKVDGGGSFYLGIAEKEKIYSSYISGVYEVRGFKYEESKHQALESSIRELVAKDTLVLYFDSGKSPSPLSQDSIDIAFHPVSPKEDLYAVEVAVAAVNGLVFYSTHGPESYELLGEDLSRLNILDWKERLFR